MSLFLRSAIELAAFALTALAGAAAGRRLGAGRRWTAAAAPAFLTLLLSAALDRWAEEAPGLAACFPPRRAIHFAAWQIFWIGVLGIRLLETAARRVYAARGRAFPLPDLLAALARRALYVAVAFLVLQRILGRDISTLLTSTALLTAVVGFALQGVLGNLLAGMSLHLVRAVVPGDWVAVGEHEGEVVEANWRETRLRTIRGHFLIVPNSRMAEAVLHNLSRPTPVRRHAVEVGASYSDAPGEVIAALLEAARSVPAVLEDPPPSAYVTAYQDFGINYELHFWSRQYHNRTPIEGDVQRMIWYQFKRRGIEIPFPMSDRLLNDFMEVVYHQRRQPPADTEIERRSADLWRSEFATRVLSDEEGRPLLGRDELRALAPLLRHVRFTAGETLFRQGAAGQSCYVVVSGRLAGRIEGENAAEPARFEAGPGAIVGEMSLLGGTPRTATVTVLEESELLEIPEPAFARLLGLRPEIPERLAQLAAQRAAANAALFERLRLKQPPAVEQSLRRESLLRRFLHLLGRG